jgi:integrase-like protein
MAMSRKLGQIIAVRENTWMIRIPMGCDPQTKQRSYYNRTVYGSLRQAQKFLGKKVNELGAYIERDGAKIRLDQYLDQWLKTVKSRICSKTFESYESLLAKYIRPSLGKKPIVAIRPLDVQAVYQHMSDRGLFAENGPRGSLGAQCGVQTGMAMGNDLGGSYQRREAATDSKARDASLQCRGDQNFSESCAADDVRDFV